MSECARRVQCKACPWKKSTDPVRDIPGGYSVKKHKRLKGTIAEEADLRSVLSPAIRMMACHESKVRREIICVGWLANQLGPGNNLALRLMAMSGKLPKYELVGEQHERFEDTLPGGEE